MQIKFTDSQMWFKAKGSSEIKILQGFDVAVDLDKANQTATVVVDLMDDATKLRVVETLLADFAKINI